MTKMASFWWSGFKWQGSVLQDQPTRMMFDVQDEKWCFMTRLSWCWSLWWFLKTTMGLCGGLWWLGLTPVAMQSSFTWGGIRIWDSSHTARDQVHCIYMKWWRWSLDNPLWIILAQSKQHELIPWYGIQCSRSWVRLSVWTDKLNTSSPTLLISCCRKSTKAYKCYPCLISYKYIEGFLATLQFPLIIRINISAEKFESIGPLPPVSKNGVNLSAAELSYNPCQSRHWLVMYVFVPCVAFI